MPGVVLIRCGSWKLQRAFRKPKGTTSHSVNSIKSFDFYTLYTTIPQDKLKFKLKEIISQCFFHKNGNRRFQYVVIGYKDTYFVRDHSDASQKYSDADVIKMLEYLIDNFLWSSADWYFNKQSAYRWVLTVHRCLPTCFYTRTKFPQSRQETPCTTIQFHLQIYRWCIVSEKYKLCRVFGIHLSTWAWNKGNNGDCSLLLILGLLSY